MNSVFWTVRFCLVIQSIPLLLALGASSTCFFKQLFWRGRVMLLGFPQPVLPSINPSTCLIFSSSLRHTLSCVVGFFQACILGQAHLQGFSFPSGCPCTAAAKWFLPMFSLAAWKVEASFLYQDILQDTFQVSRVVFCISDLPVPRHSSRLLKI